MLCPPDQLSTPRPLSVSNNYNLLPSASDLMLLGTQCKRKHPAIYLFCVWLASHRVLRAQSVSESPSVLKADIVPVDSRIPLWFPLIYGWALCYFCLLAVTSDAAMMLLMTITWAVSFLASFCFRIIRWELVSRLLGCDCFVSRLLTQKQVTVEFALVHLQF